jgi:AbrB family looped-hinge helix DNA binding protein
MSKVTGKYQLTLPKRLAASYGIKVGDEVEIMAAGDAIAVLPTRSRKAAVSSTEQLQHFDQATSRQRQREGTSQLPTAEHRDWNREEIYTRGRSR